MLFLEDVKVETVQVNDFYIEFGRNKKGADGNPIFSRNDYRLVNWGNYIQTLSSYIHDPKNQGWGLYCTAYQYSSADIQAAHLRGDFILDFDSEDNIRLAQEDALRAVQYLVLSPNYKIPQNMIRIYFSGKKGLHVVVPYQCFGIEWHQRLDQIYKIMAEELLPHIPNKTLDLKIFERRRLIRLAGSKHPSTDAYKVPMELKHLLTKSEKEIQQMAQNPQYGKWIRYEHPREIIEAARYFKEAEKKFEDRFANKFSKNRGDSTIDFDPPCYDELIENGPLKGSRNHVACMLTTFWRQRGLSEQDAWDNLVDWNNGSLSDRELKTCFNSNFRGHYIYGCNTIKQYASCPATCRKDCKFYKEEQ